MTKRNSTKESSEKGRRPKDKKGEKKNQEHLGVEEITLESSASTAGTAELDAPLSPSKIECIIWRNGSFRKRVLLAVAQWAMEKPENISPSDTLGSLAKGVPWEEGPGQQADLVQSTNDPAIDVFAPFPGTRMSPPSEQLPASTTVAQWERKVWQQQSPRTPCFFKVP